MPLTRSQLANLIAGRLASNDVTVVVSPKDFREVMLEILSAALLTSENGQKSAVVSSAPVTYTSNATPADFPNFSFTLLGSTTYDFEIVLPMTAGAAGGGKFVLTGTTDVTQLTYEYEFISAAAVAAGVFQGATLTGATAGATAAAVLLRIRGTIATGANGGTFKLQVSQNVSNGTATTFYTGGIMTVETGAVRLP